MARSVGETFATSDSELLRYLRALKDDWAEADHLLQELEPHLSSTGNSSPPPSRPASVQPNPAQVLARIVDIDEKGRIVDASASLTVAEIQQDYPDRASVVDSFVDTLRSCKTTNVSCRILLLGDEEARRQWPASALCLQLLAVELDLTLPRVLSVMDWVIDPFLYCASIGVLPYWDSQTLRFGVRRRPYGTASYVASCCVLGTRQLSGHSLDMVAVSLQDFCAPAMPFVSTLNRDELRGSLLRSSLGGLLQIPTSSAALSSPKSQDARGLSSLDSIEVFTHLVSHRPSSVSSVAPGTSTITWLRALISMSMFTACVELDRMWRERPTHTEGIDRMAQELSSLHEAVQGDIRTVSDFAQRLSPAAEKDLGDCISNLHRIAARVKNEEEQTRADADRRSRSTNLEMAQRSIAESRSTIALTVLAAVYLPLSLASSIFGMNVREINPEHNRIWEFVVVALGIAAVTALIWWAWRFFKNAGAITKYLRRQVMEGELAPEDARDLNSFLASRGVERWKRFQYLLGLRSIEKSGAMWDR